MGFVMTELVKSSVLQDRLDEMDRSPAWLADQIGVSERTVYRYFRRERMPRARLMTKLVTIMGEQAVSAHFLSAAVDDAQAGA